MTDQKEHDWHLKKVGKFSASRAKDLMSASGKWIEGNIDYLYEIQYQRLTGEPEPPITARPMRIGIENEPYAIAWVRENCPDLNVLHCDADFTEKIFDEPYADLNFGASPDAFVMSNMGYAIETDEGKLPYGDEIKNLIYALLEVKCVVGRKETVRYFSPTLSIDIKKDMVKKEHGWQMAAQMFAYPNVQKIYLLKYLPQMDDNEWDLRPASDPSRGIMFEFSRGELAIEIATFEHRLRVADAYLKSGRDLEKINDLKIGI